MWIKFLLGPKDLRVVFAKQANKTKKPSIFFIKFEGFFVDNDTKSSHCTEIVLVQGVPVERHKRTHCSSEKILFFKGSIERERQCYPYGADV